MIARMIEPHVVFILSTNYAGSHLLLQLLAAHPCCAGVGELHNYRKFRERGSRSGNVVNDYLEHPAFAALDALPEADWHARIFERLQATQPALTHLIDNSKRSEWAARFEPARSRYVHLLRDPRALVSRWLDSYDTPRALAGQRRRVLRRRPWLAGRLDPVRVYVEKWLLANRAISRFVARRAGTARVTYRDLASSTSATLTQLMPAFGLSFETAQLDYGAAGSALGTRKRDYQDAARDSVIALDLRWQERLGAQQRRAVETHVALARYLAELGLELADDGLTARR